MTPGHYVGSKYFHAALFTQLYSRSSIHEKPKSIQKERMGYVSRKRQAEPMGPPSHPIIYIDYMPLKRDPVINDTLTAVAAIHKTRHRQQKFEPRQVELLCC